MSTGITIIIPTNDEALTISLPAGRSVMFVGANGSGKTRLAVHLEHQLKLRSHRISAHRALSLNPGVPKISEKNALMGLRTGYADEKSSFQHRAGHRWQSKHAVLLLNDFDYLVQALFAEQANTSLQAYNRYKPNGTTSNEEFKLTQLDRLKSIWERLLPLKRLQITGDDIQVYNQDPKTTYTASEMSDGERAIFYLIGQVLVAEKNSVLIIDEPELHVHRSIMSNTWDLLEAERPDCIFVFITHDLEFASTRSALKYVMHYYNPKPYWLLEEVPQATGFDEKITTLILGSRHPVLFVEGNEDSLDLGIYRSCYPSWTIIPCGSCTAVIHSVTTMRKHSSLSRITCCGIVDGDNYKSEEREKMHSMGVHVLPVAEIENVILLPAVSRAIAKHEGYSDDKLETVLFDLESQVLENLTNDELGKLSIRYCIKRLDRALKQVDLSDAQSIEELEILVSQRVEGLDVRADSEELVEKIRKSIEERKLGEVLEHYDNKGLVALAALHLKHCKKSEFIEWLTRILGSDKGKEVLKAFREALPKLEEKKV